MFVDVTFNEKDHYFVTAYLKEEISFTNDFFPLRLIFLAPHPTNNSIPKPTITTQIESILESLSTQPF